MIVVVMEPELTNPDNWAGSIDATMGMEIFLDFTKDANASTVIDQLAELLR